MVTLASDSITVSTVNDGDDGLPGKDGTGIQTTTITYASSTSGTTAPSTGWTSAVPTVPAGSYLWTKTVWGYTDNTSETGYSVAMMGVKGDKGKSVWYYPHDRGANSIGSWWSDLEPTPTTDNPPKVGDTIIDLVGNIYQITNVVVTTAQEGGGLFDYGPKLTSIKGDPGTDGTSGIIVSSVAPDSPQTGQLWQDTSTTPQLVKKWTGSEWVIWKMYVENMVVNTISSMSSNLGDITAGTYTSWSIEDYNVYDYLSAIYLFKGGIRFFTIENPNTTDPDTSGVASGKMIRGLSIISGVIQFYQQQIPLEDTRTANEMLKEVDGFWTPYSDVGGYCGSISSYKYSGGIGQLTLNADLISVQGELKTNVGTISNSSSISVALFYGITVVFRRQGNLVIASIARQARTTSTTGEDIMTNEKVPLGYRPSYSHYFGINRNSGTNILKTLVMGFASNGDVRVTIGETGTAIFTGSTSYFTTDPLP